VSAGDVVITGAVGSPQDVGPGQRVAVEVAPLGMLSLELTERTPRP
jgi:2-keto-4-pentenoate hydratase